MLVLRRAFRRLHSSSWVGLSQVGSSSMIRWAVSRASCTICPSRAMSAIFRSNAMPLCCVPSRSPGPRSFRSASAISKPSLVEHMISMRRLVSLLRLRVVTRMQNDCSAPRPTRPRNWWSWESPKRWASIITITEALGTLTPTSITVVATRIWVSPLTNFRISSSFS